MGFIHRFNEESAATIKSFGQLPGGSIKLPFSVQQFFTLLRFYRLKSVFGIICCVTASIKRSQTSKLRSLNQSVLLIPALT